MCNKHRKPNCGKTCKECQWYDKNIEKLMRENTGIDETKIKGR